MRGNPVVSSQNNKIRDREVKQQQTKDLLKWKKKNNRYGYRRMMARETAFSLIKRMFADEHVSATRFQTSKRNDVEGIFVQSI